MNIQKSRKIAGEFHTSPSSCSAFGHLERTKGGSSDMSLFSSASAYFQKVKGGKNETGKN